MTWLGKEEPEEPIISFLISEGREKLTEDKTPKTTEQLATGSAKRNSELWTEGGAATYLGSRQEWADPVNKWIQRKETGEKAETPLAS